MILVALLLLAIGAADIARASIRSLPAAVAIATALFVIGAILTGVPHWWAWSLGAAALVSAWVALTRGGLVVTPHERRGAKGALALLAVAVVALWAVSGSIVAGIESSFGWFGAPPAIFASYSPTTIATVLGVGVFLIESGNVIVRIALSSAESAHADDDEQLRQWLIPGEASIGGLKGGRLIGPFERLFILALALAGQYTAIGAIVAAKGIVRFPEISRNDSNGSKAEEFLVGSFASWALVLASVLLIAATSV